MFCSKCGARLIEDAAFCAVCGEKVSSASPNGGEPINNTEGSEQTGGAYGSSPITFEDLSNSAATKMVTAFSSSHFLALCILFTVAVGASALAGSVNIIGILFVVGLWMARSAAAANNPVAFGAPTKMISTLITINVVLQWIAVGLLVLASVFLVIAGIMVPSFEESLVNIDPNSVYESIIIEGGAGLEEVFTYDDFASAWETMVVFFIKGGFIIFGVITLVVAIVMALLNIFCYHSIRRCAKSFVEAYNTNENCFKSVNVAANWLLVLGIFQVVSAIGTLSSFNIVFTVAAAAEAAAMITASQLLKKYFV